jgi:hypothetical protein
MLISLSASLSSLNFILAALLLYKSRSVICVVSTFSVNGLVPVIVCPRSVWYNVSPGIPLAVFLDEVEHKKRNNKRR